MSDIAGRSSTRAFLPTFQSPETPAEGPQVKLRELQRLANETGLRIAHLRADIGQVMATVKGGLVNLRFYSSFTRG